MLEDRSCVRSLTNGLGNGVIDDLNNTETNGGETVDDGEVGDLDNTDTDDGQTVDLNNADRDQRWRD